MNDLPFGTWVVFRLRNPLVAMLTLAVASTCGYVVVEHFGWVDALYMTVITLGTIGYGEVRPLDTAGRFLTISIIVAGFATVVYAASVLTNVFSSGEASQHLQERRARKMQEQLRDHVIVVGFGRVGQAVVRSLQAIGRSCVVIDTNTDLGDEIGDSGVPHVVGDATNEDHLRRAGIDHAAGLVAAADKDSTNLVVVLTARAMRADLRIASRVNEASWLSRIHHAGADVAQSPYDSYGASLAASALSPVVLDLHDLPMLGFGTEEILVAAESTVVGRSPEEIALDHLGVHLLALRRDQQLHRWHEVAEPVRAGDVLLALGTSQHLTALADRCAGRAS